MGSLSKLLTSDSSKAKPGYSFKTPDNKVVYFKNDIDDEKIVRQVKVAMKSSNIYNRTSEITAGIEANTDSAVDVLTPFLPYLQLIIGIIVVLITVGMTLFSALDIVYIAFPVFRNFCETKSSAGGKGTTTTPDGDSKVIWITDDAFYAVKTGSIDSDKSPWGIYFGRRVVSYIILAIILFILMTGNINLITDIALNLVSGIIDVLIEIS